MEYSEDAFARAERENKPVLMVISAVWCYNCQVYEAALDSQEVSQYVNERYVPVFVDYDRRRDIARAYPLAGIPVTSIFAPNGKLIVSAPGYFTQDELLANLELTREHIAKGLQRAGPEKEPERRRSLMRPTTRLLRGYIEDFSILFQRSFDPAFGGFGLAEKEPFAGVLIRFVEMKREGDNRWSQPVRTTLDHMLGREQRVERKQKFALEALIELRQKQTELLREVNALQTEDKIAGIYDAIDGGFFRYATRRDRTVPHFEKMLFENAEIIDLFLTASAVYEDPAYTQAAEKSIEYLVNNLYEDGRFVCSQTADEVY
jgi:uncharacterized protein YyaL (SSP411 family)